MTWQLHLLLFLVCVVPGHPAHLHVDGLPDKIFYQKGDLDVAHLFGYTKFSDSELCGVGSDAWLIPFFEGARYVIINQ